MKKWVEAIVGPVPTSEESLQERLADIEDRGNRYIKQVQHEKMIGRLCSDSSNLSLPQRCAMALLLPGQLGSTTPLPHDPLPDFKIWLDTVTGDGETRRRARSYWTHFHLDVRLLPQPAYEHVMRTAAWKRQRQFDPGLIKANGLS